MFIDLSDLESSSNDDCTSTSALQTKRTLDDNVDLEKFIFGDSSSFDDDDGSADDRFHSAAASLPRDYPMTSVTESLISATTSLDEDSDDTGPYLVCHRNGPMPQIAMCTHNKLYHAECLKCTACANQILPPKCFLEMAKSPKTTILCTECAERAEQVRKMCNICRHEVEGENDAVELQKGFFVHNQCLHCACCSRTPAKVGQFAVIEGSLEKYVICKDCVAVMNGAIAKDANSVYIGRLIPEIVPKKFHCRCQRCSRKLKNNVFIFANFSVLCIDCGIHSFQSRKK